MSRERLYAILSSRDDNDKVASIYNFCMIVLIVLWMLPLWFKGEYFGFMVLDRILTAIFVVDYLLRWATADFKLKRGKMSFLIYPFTPMAILDLVSLIPSFIPTNGSLKAVRLLRILGALRAFKLIRHSKTIRILMDAARSQRMPLLVTLVLAVVYVYVCATVMFNLEPETYDTFLDALYWSVISLTTIGYGDITPSTAAGRLVAMVSAFAGVAIIAFPSGIIAAGMINELDKKNWDEVSERIHRVGRLHHVRNADQEDLVDEDLVDEPDQEDEADQED